MTARSKLGRICTIALAIVTLSSFAVFAEGCNTSEPPNRQIKDAQVTTQVKAKLASEVRPSSLANVEVNTTNGVVTLAGQVESPEVRNRAQAVTASVPGVVRVNNNLQVASSSAPVGQ